MCDTFAFIFGSKYGRKKIFPSVSPNKTIVGSISGIAGSAIIAISFYYIIDIYDFTIKLDSIDVLFFTLLLGGVGQVGDLFESYMKRQANVKDTSKILSGHGGFLDRFDSISFAAPVYYLYISYFII